MKIITRSKWNLMLADPRKSKNGIRSLGIPGYLMAVCALALTAGLVGFGRLGYVSAKYAIAVYDAREQSRENNSLREQVESLDKFIAQQAEGIARLAEYEEDARKKYGMETINADVRMAGVGGIPTFEEILFTQLRDPLVSKAESLRLQVLALNRQAELQEQTFEQMSAHVQNVHRRLSNRPSIWPARGRLTSGFGFRYHPFTGLRLMHEGIDIANSEWTPIHATADGIVRESNSRTHFGNVVQIDHGDEYSTLYAHLRRSAVTAGQTVRRGDVIGYMGSTGRSTGTHLHYEVRREGRLVNPILFIVPEEQIVD